MMSDVLYLAAFRVISVAWQRCRERGDPAFKAARSVCHRRRHLMAMHLTRRQLLGTMSMSAVGLVGFERAVAAAQGELAEDQTLRLVSWAIPPYIRPQNEGGPLRMMTENTFMPPFYEDEAGTLLPGICTDWSVSDDALVYTLKFDPRAK